MSDAEDADSKPTLDVNAPLSQFVRGVVDGECARLRTAGVRPLPLRVTRCQSLRKEDGQVVEQIDIDTQAVFVDVADVLVGEPTEVGDKALVLLVVFTSQQSVEANMPYLIPAIVPRKSKLDCFRFVNKDGKSVEVKIDHEDHKR